MLFECHAIPNHSKRIATGAEGSFERFLKFTLPVGESRPVWGGERALTLVVLHKSDHQPHSAPKQKNAEQEMSNFEGK